MNKNFDMINILLKMSPRELQAFQEEMAKEKARKENLDKLNHGVRLPNGKSTTVGRFYNC